MLRIATHNTQAQLRSKVKAFSAMSTQAQPSVRHHFFVYAPDKTQAGTLEQRLQVRPTHVAIAKNQHDQGTIRVGGALLTPESLATPTTAKKMIGSAFIFEAESIDEVKRMIKEDIYYTQGVWDPEKVVILPFLSAFPLP